ncbi:MAG: DUF2726 domain-containing protein [Puia sp.]|nr:DUF2726 domain-containing protein [Puia sp.]
MDSGGESKLILCVPNTSRASMRGQYRRFEAMLKKILVNRYEEASFMLLKKQADDEQAHVFSKVAPKEIVPFETTKLSKELNVFCWRAHFDFVVTDSAFMPLFVVEFDGPSHQSEKQACRDRKKDELCRIFSLPILRINSRYLEPAYRGTDLLSWFAECFFTNRAFTVAEENGWISPEDGFSPMAISSIGDRHDWPLDLSHGVRDEFRKLHKDGQIFDDQPSFLIGRDSLGTYRAFAFIAVTKETGVFAKTAMRSQQFEIDQADALEILIYFEIFEALKKVLKGTSKPERLASIMEKMETAARGVIPSREATMNSDWTTRSMFQKTRLVYGLRAVC